MFGKIDEPLRQTMAYDTIKAADRRSASDRFQNRHERKTSSQKLEKDILTNMAALSNSNKRMLHIFKKVSKPHTETTVQNASTTAADRGLANIRYKNTQETKCSLQTLEEDISSNLAALSESYKTMLCTLNKIDKHILNIFQTRSEELERKTI